MNQCSVNHVFLTGKKQIGKSTFLKKVLAVYPKCPAGFYTVRTNAFLETSYSAHLFSAKLPEKQRIPTEENLLFLCGNPAYDPIERFNRLGCAALLHSDAPSLMIMDELGPNEGKALDFQRAVFCTGRICSDPRRTSKNGGSFFDKNSPSSAGACI